MNIYERKALKSYALFSRILFSFLLIAFISNVASNDTLTISLASAETMPIPRALGNEKRPSLRIFSSDSLKSNNTSLLRGNQSLASPQDNLSIKQQNGFGYAYEVIAIEPLPGFERSRNHGINNSGEVVGRFFNYNTVTESEEDRQAFIWDRTNGARTLPTLSGETSAWAINDDGLVTGYSANAGGYGRAVRWDSNDDTIVDIGALTNTSTGSSGDSSLAYGINSLGQVVGNADIPNDAGDFVPFHGFLYDDAEGIQDLGTLTTAWPEWQNGYSIAYDINIHGEIVGIAHDSDWAFLAFIHDETNGMQALARDPNYLSGEWYAVAINDSGLIGGHVVTSTNQSLPFYWDNSSADPVQIITPAGFPYGETYGINESGQMVGIMWDSDQVGALEHAFIFDTKDGIRDLNDLIDPGTGWVLFFAISINNSGQIVGYGELNGEARGFVLNPITIGDELAVDFGGSGLWHYDQAEWRRISSGNSATLATFNGDLVADFDADGLYFYDGTWTKISTGNVDENGGMIGIGTDLFVDFGSSGLWKYDGVAWTRISTANAEGLAGYNSQLAADFGTFGLYLYDGTWTRISTGNADGDGGMIGTGSDLYVDFGGSGLWRYDGASWVRISTGNPETLASYNNNLVADFGPYGLYLYNGTWTRISTGDAEGMIEMASDLYVDFGPSGLWKYDAVTFTQISTGDAGILRTYGNKLAVDFGTNGLYEYDGIWTRISTGRCEDMVDLNIY